LTLSNTSSFLTWSVQLIFSILLQHHISKLTRCFFLYDREIHKFIICIYEMRSDYPKLTAALKMPIHINLLKPTGYFTYHQV
jgi:hypothetical protein